MFRILILASLFLLFLTACQKQDDAETTSVPPRPVPTIGPTPSPRPEVPNYRLSAAVEALPAANQYQVRLTWQTNDKPKSWRLFRVPQDGGTPSLIYSSDDLTVRAYLDSEVPSGETVSYEIRVSYGDGFTPKAQAEIGVPKDLELADLSEEKAFTGINRLFLTKDAYVRTGGAPLTIDVNELQSEGATLDSAPKGPNEASRDGRSAGKITVRAKTAVGTVRVIGNGEGGTAGKDGTNGQDGAPGSQGAPGQWAVNPEWAKNLQPSYVESIVRHINFFRSGPDDPVWRAAFGPQPFICSKRPENGASGGKGGNGNDGEDGGNGGASAEVDFAIESSGFQVFTGVEPGNGAIGGRGGNGGKGGPGGPPGALDQGHLCLQAATGPVGETGLNGRQGQHGIKGAKSPVCIRVGGELFGNCNQ